MPLEDGNVGLAFALVAGAGAATGIGAVVVYFPSLIKLASTKVLAGCLGVSAGVMLYVSFVEILTKSKLGFIDAGESEANAYLYSTLSFFGGVISMLFIDKLVHLLDVDNNPTVDGKVEGGVEKVGSSPVANLGGNDNNDSSSILQKQQKKNKNSETTTTTKSTLPHTHSKKCDDRNQFTRSATGHSIDAEEIESWQQLAIVEEKKTKSSAVALGSSSGSSTPGDGSKVVSRRGGDEDMEKGMMTMNSTDGTIGFDENNEEAVDSNGQTESEKKLVRMGLNTALAIGIHNFPEGLATFVGAVDDPSVGVTLAIAIAIHNIPEGLCVAIPIFYATGDRRKAFMWAMLSGISEPIGAFFGWLILAAEMGDVVYGILFGVVGGMMVTICLHELLPTAHRYDKNDEVVTLSCIAGMAVMATSLILFLY